jgi:hypothetical protein
MSNILKISSLLFFTVRKPIMIQRPLTTTYILCKEEKKITPKLERKTIIKKENSQNKKIFSRKRIL